MLSSFMDPFEFRLSKLDQTIKWIAENPNAIVTESDTRFKIIDEILVHVLGWPKELINTEEQTDNGRIDYNLVVDGANKAVVEAKREAIDFRTEARHSGDAYILKGPAISTEARAAVVQVISYCAFKNAELGCATNGKEWIIFRANRLGDGKETMNGKGFVFNSLEAVREHFSLFADLLSLESINSLKYRGVFQEAEGIVLRDPSFFQSFRTPDSKNSISKTTFALDFDEIMSSFFRRLKGEEDRDMIEDCFVVTRESEIAETKLVRVAEELVSKMREIDSGTGKQLTDMIEAVQRSHKNRFAILVGAKGAGKSTFIDRFFRTIIPEEISRGLAVIRLDLSASDGDEHRIIPWLNKHLLEKCEASVFTIDSPSWDETIGSMFFDEYRRWSFGSMKHLYDSDKTAFKIEFGKHIEELRRNDPHEVIKRLLRHIVHSRKLIPCVVLDNTDHYSISFQQTVFQYARSIYESELCAIIIPITDRTSWELSKHGALQSFESEFLYLPVPQPHRVIERRIAYLTKKLSENNEHRAKEYFIGRNIRLDIKNISAFAAGLNRIFVESRTTSEWLGGLANYDIRRLLEITRDVVSSPHIPLDDILKAHLAGSTFPVKDWRILQAIIKRQYDIFPEGEHSFVQNVFNISEDVPTTPLLALRILQFLRDAEGATEHDKKSFIPIEKIYSHLLALGIEQRNTKLSLNTLLEKGLILDYDPTVTTVDRANRVELSPSGRVHLIWGSTNEEYIKVMRDVTPLRDRSIFHEMSDQIRHSARDWARPLETFINYLIQEDRRYITIPDHRSFEGQRRIEYRLTHVKNSALSARHKQDSRGKFQFISAKRNS